MNGGTEHESLGASFIIQYRQEQADIHHVVFFSNWSLIKNIIRQLFLVIRRKHLMTWHKISLYF